jgi:hypothetical protein
VPRGAGEDLEDVVRWSADPPRHGDGLVLMVSHQNPVLPSVATWHLPVLCS